MWCSGWIFLFMTSLGGMIYVQTKSSTEHHCPIKDHWKIHISLQRGSLLCPSDTLQCNLCNAGKRMWLMGLGVGAFCEGYWGLGVGVVAFQVGLSLSPGPPLCHGNEPWRGKRGDQASSLFPPFFNPLLKFQFHPLLNQVLVNVFFLKKIFPVLLTTWIVLARQAGGTPSGQPLPPQCLLSFFLFVNNFNTISWSLVCKCNQPSSTSIWQEKTGDVGQFLSHFCKASNDVSAVVGSYHQQKSEIQRTR